MEKCLCWKELNLENLPERDISNKKSKHEWILFIMEELFIFLIYCFN